MKTRFKMWWRLIGSAVEHAAKLTQKERKENKLLDSEVDFQKLFLARDDDDEDTDSLADALVMMHKEWSGKKFTADDVATFVNYRTRPDAVPTYKFPDAAALREFLYPAAPPDYMATPKSAGKRLKNHLDEPVKKGNYTYILRREEDKHTDTWRYSVVKTVTTKKAEDPGA